MLMTIVIHKPRSPFTCEGARPADSDRGAALATGEHEPGTARTRLLQSPFLFYEEIRPLGSRARAGVRRARFVPRRIPGFVDPVAARDRRPPRRVDGHAPQI